MLWRYCPATSLYYVRPSSRVRKELDPLRAGRFCTGVSEPTSKGFPLVPDELAWTGGSEPTSTGFPLVTDVLALWDREIKTLSLMKTEWLLQLLNGLSKVCEKFATSSQYFCRHDGSWPCSEGFALDSPVFNFPSKPTIHFHQERVDTVTVWACHYYIVLYSFVWFIRCIYLFHFLNNLPRYTLAGRWKRRTWHSRLWEGRQGRCVTSGWGTNRSRSCHW